MRSTVENGTEHENSLTSIDFLGLIDPYLLEDAERKYFHISERKLGVRDSLLSFYFQLPKIQL